MDKVILHSDINSCYASIELLHHPELRGKPLAVGGDPEARHGIVLAKDQIAKSFGVKTGMPLWQARNLCPEITFLPPRMELYLRFSQMAHELYREYTDLQQPFGIDECWLDVTGTVGIFGSGMDIARAINRRMKEELGITVSIGVSYNKIFAKLGSDYKKPDAITEITRDNYKDIVWSLPAGDLLYVGRNTKLKLKAMGIYTIGQLAAMNPFILKRKLGKMGEILHGFANGNDLSEVTRENYNAPIKSIGNSTTTPRDLTCDEDVWIVIYMLAESVAARLRSNGFKAMVVEISIRDNELFSFTRQKKVMSPTNITGEIASEAYKLFKGNYSWKKPIRSVGVRASCLVLEKMPEQTYMFMDAERRIKQEKIDETLDIIRRRFGYYSIRPAVMYMDSNLSHSNPAEDHVAHPQGYF